MDTYLALNDYLPGRVAYAKTLEEAQAISWPDGRPNVIACSDGRAWVASTYPNRAAQWFQTTLVILRYQAVRHGAGNPRVATIDLAYRNFEVAGMVGGFGGIK